MRTMFTRSQDYLLQDKMILVIGAGGYSNKFIWPSALEMGVKVSHIFRGYSNKFIWPSDLEMVIMVSHRAGDCRIGPAALNMGVKSDFSRL